MQVNDKNFSKIQFGILTQTQHGLNVGIVIRYVEKLVCVNEIS